MLASNYIMGSVIMNGTSQWLNRIGERVASDKVTISLKARDDRLATAEPFTADGYRSEDVTVIGKGVLNTFLLNLYAAKKTGRPVTKNTSMAMVMEAGETPLADMIASMDRGLIVGGFSGGEPGANGEFSGVAKNSFYVEHGRVVGAVTETMINGNLESIFRNVLAVSREQVCDGSSVLPYLCCDGIVISGK
jgi:PmbA protein